MRIANVDLRPKFERAAFRMNMSKMAAETTAYCVSALQQETDQCRCLLTLKAHLSRRNPTSESLAASLETESQ